MYSLIFLGILSFLASLAITPLVRNVFRRFGIFDQPSDRKRHPHAIPRVGGIAIAATYVLASGCMFLVNLRAGAANWHSLDFVIRIAPAILVVFVIGFIDDIRGLQPWHKLTGQVTAAVMAYAAGVQIHGIAGHDFSGWWSLPLTVVWLVACTNAVNLIDGVDGLAAGVGFFATCTTLFAALLLNNVSLALATIPLAGCLLGFLRYNFNPATIFLGDCGSLFIGFLLGCYGILWSQKAVTILGMTAPLMALSIPLLDTLLAIARRFLTQQPIFTADRGHIHHRLLDRGLTPRNVTLTLYAFCALGAICSLLMMSRNASGMIIVIFCFITWIGVQHLGYVEFGTAGRLFLDGAFRRLLNAQITLQSYEERLIAASTPQHCWEIVRDACRGFGFHRVEMTLTGQTFDWEDGVCPMNSWNVTIPISDHDYVRLTRSFNGGTQPNIITPFADALRRTLAPKLPVFLTPPCPDLARLSLATEEGVQRKTAARATGRSQDLVPRFTRAVESLDEEAPAAALPNASNGIIPKRRAASAGSAAERTYSAGD